jgi:hypothetical protein
MAVTTKSYPRRTHADIGGYRGKIMMLHGIDPRLSAAIRG